MSIWISKAIIQKTISLLPYPHQLNFLFQKYVTRGVVLSDALFDDKLQHCSRHIKYLQKYSGVKTRFIALEIGTGWYPIVPIGLYLYGADKVYTIDIALLLNTGRVYKTIEKYIQLAEKGLPFEINVERLARLKQIAAQPQLPYAELLRELNIESIIGDARKTELAAQSIDLINSNNTFEHIYPKILIDILKEFKRLAKPGGIMSHAIDMSDHFAHLDKSITPYNYLKFTEDQWKWIDNSIQPQNRMRLYEYEKLYRQLSVPIVEKVITGKGNDSIKQVRLAERFKNHPLEETAVLHASIISHM